MDRQVRPSASTVGVGGKSRARLTLARSGINPDTITSKLVRNRNQDETTGVNGYLGPGSMLNAYETTARVSGAIEDAENLLRLNPELEIAQQVLISMILAPKDFIHTNLTYSLPPATLPSAMVDGMINVAKTFYETSYNIKAKLPKRLRKALFEVGSYITAIIPENSLDDLIHGRGNHAGPGGARMTMESISTQQNHRDDFMKTLTKPLGWLGGKKKNDGGQMTVESMLTKTKTVDDGKGIEGYGEMAIDAEGLKFGDNFVKPILYDNPNLLRLPRALEGMGAAKRKMAMESIGGGMFSGYDTSPLEEFFKDVPAGSRPADFVSTIDNASRPTKGHPLWIDIPPEAFIPAYVPGDPERKVGGYCILDEMGMPITRHGSAEYFRNMYNVGTSSGNRSKLSSLLKEAGQEETEYDIYRDVMRQQQAMKSFEDATIRELEARADSGSLGSISLARQQQAFQIMMARGLAGRQTRILFLPAELFVFWSFDVNEDGTGRSLLENTKLISSMRGLTLVSNMENQIRNSIDHNTLDIQIDDRDPSPQKTRDAIINSYALRAGSTVPWANGNPRHMAEYLALRGTSITVQGGNSTYPGTKVEVVARDVALKEIDMSFDESLAKREMMGIGIPPELVDLSTQIEFSSKMAVSNDLANKRAAIYSTTTSGFLKDELTKLIINSSVLRDALLKEIGKHVSELSEGQKKLGEQAILFLFLSYLEVSLPMPSNGLTQKREAFDEFKDAVDGLLDILFSDDLFGSDPNEAAEDDSAPKKVKAMYRSLMIVTWCRENDYLTELIDLMDIDKIDGVGATMARDAMRGHLTVAHVIKAIGLQLEASKTIAGNQWAFIKQALEKFKLAGTEEEESSYDSGSDDSGGGGEDDFNNDDDFFAGDDEPKDEPEPEEEEEEEEEEEQPDPKDDGADAGKNE